MLFIGTQFSNLYTANRVGRTIFGASETEVGPAILCYGQEVNVYVCMHIISHIHANACICMV